VVPQRSDGSGPTVRRLVIGQHQGLVLINPPGGNGPITPTQARQHLPFLAPGDQPDDAPARLSTG